MITPFMKTTHRGLVLLVFVMLLIPSLAWAQDEYYVTVGVFAVQDNAIRYTAKANKAGFNAQYAINTQKNYYYVYLLQTPERRKAVSFMVKVRAESEYKDAWVFIGRLGMDRPAEEKPVEKPVEPVVTPVIAPAVVETKPETTPAKKDSVIEVKPTPPPAKRVVKGKLFTFKLINAENGNEVRGEVHFAESKKATQYQAFKADEVIDLPTPRNAAGVYYITTIAPGYKPISTPFNFKDPMPVSSGTGPEGEIIVPLSLERAKRGDYIEFTNVNFYRNSVVLHPESQMELDGLADLMKEHKDYEVRIHGHCNSNDTRDIITLGTSTKFFESDPGNVKKKASAKELTELRADAVRRYIVSQGVEEGRLKIKGEGGKLMVYPQNSVYANYNDRVEVEIIRH